MKKIINLVLVFIILSFTGCSYFNIGEPMGSCEEQGCNYADAGICGDVFNIYKTRYKDIEKSYENIDCSRCKGKR
ncbi:hypothetical protein CP985_03455 [Malaciobacter mytili LMG 24559]|uniref:Lipoprotein n=1 Tax=Malaciobacter mytili LMG 24559 TaxID=1032238 RepID=A0AAX2AL60_9BACT|nr:hypothetical protein [Malaciobacter mytili]AXH16414.1 F-type type IV conjugative transfer system protein TraB [Malaciobacter mytili LMG 24559]RXK16481.1 hypothetical protein CP985_03455 [Malaciobacter mytili LMG 24559]